MISYTSSIYFLGVWNSDHHCYYCMAHSVCMAYTVGDVDSEDNSARKLHKNIFVENVIKTSLNYSYLKIAH